MAKPVFPLLVCPLSKQRLLPVSGRRLERLYALLKTGALHYVDGTPLAGDSERIGFLITENARHLYIVIDDVPVMLENRQVDISALQL